jgi:hypothetical protein
VALRKPLDKLLLGTVPQAALYVKCGRVELESALAHRQAVPGEYRADILLGQRFVGRLPMFRGDADVTE